MSDIHPPCLISRVVSRDLVHTSTPRCFIHVTFLAIAFALPNTDAESCGFIPGAALIPLSISVFDFDRGKVVI